jgi:hypothetical protein
LWPGCWASSATGCAAATAATAKWENQFESQIKSFVTMPIFCQNIWTELWLAGKPDFAFFCFKLIEWRLHQFFI